MDLQKERDINTNGGAGTWDNKEYGYATDLVHATVKPDPQSGAILTPVYRSTTFVQESIDKYLDTGYSYSRTSNPTVNMLEKKCALLEHGFGAACFSTGMAATVTVMSAILEKGDHCIITDCSYGGTNRVARMQFAKYGIQFSFVDFRELSNVKAAVKENTKLIFF